MKRVGLSVDPTSSIFIDWGYRITDRQLYYIAWELSYVVLCNLLGTIDMYMLAQIKRHESSLSKIWHKLAHYECQFSVFGSFVEQYSIFPWYIIFFFFLFFLLKPWNRFWNGLGIAEEILWYSLIWSKLEYMDNLKFSDNAKLLKWSSPHPQRERNSFIQYYL